MKQLFHSVTVLRYLVLFFALVSFPLGAQVTPVDSLPNRPSQPFKRGFNRLKAALMQHTGTAEEVDSLLTLTRQLGYLPGQVVALCQLAGIRQQQQPQQATALVQEAERIAGQIRDVREAGWAMSQLGNMQRTNSRLAPSIYLSLTPVMEALGKAMSMSAAMAGNLKEPGSFSVDMPNFPDKRMGGRRSFPPSMPDGKPSPSFPFVDPTQAFHNRLKPDFVDRWLDTLIRFDKRSPQEVSQLTARKKIRDSSQELSKAFAREGDYAKAYKYFLQYSSYKDSLTAEATSRRLATLAYKQSLLKKEAQIQLLTKDRQLREQESNRQRQYVFLMIGCIVLLGAFSFVLSRNNRAKQQANRQLSEQKEALQQTLAQLKTTQTQLIQSEKMASLGELTAGIAHEIQNPLNFVNNFSEVSTELVSELIEHRQTAPRDEELEDELLGDVQLNLQKISQHGSRASAIIKGMLEHARTSTGQRELTDLNALTEEYAKLAYHGIQARDKTFEAQLTIVLDPMLGKTRVVPQEIGRVLLNIVNNAFYAVQKRQQQEGPDYKPEVAVYTTQDAHSIHIKVRDNGTGIPDAIKNKVFQPFFTTKPSGQGTGLGLSLSYDIITKGHGGTFVLNSKEGEFTELTIGLPLATGY